MATTTKPTTTKQPVYNSIDQLVGGILPGGVKPAGATDPQAAADKEAQKACIAQGGQWDPSRRVCIMPNAIKNQTETKPTGSYEAKKGGYTDETGKFYPTTNPDFVPNAASTTTQIKFNQDGSIDYTPKGSAEAIKLTKEEYNTLTQGTGNITNAVKQAQTPVPQQVVNTPLTQEQQNVNVVPQEPIAEGVTTLGGAIAGGLAGAGTGAAIGSVVPGVGTAIGGAVGAVVGAVGGAFTKIGIDKRGDVKQAFTVAKTENTNFGQLIDYVNAGGDPAIARKRFNESKANLYASQRFLKEQTSSELSRFLSDGADEAVKIDDYIADLENYYEPEFNNAILNPSGKVKYSVSSISPAIEAE